MCVCVCVVRAFLSVAKSLNERALQSRSCCRISSVRNTLGCSRSTRLECAESSLSGVSFAFRGATRERQCSELHRGTPRIQGRGGWLATSDKGVDFRGSQRIVSRARGGGAGLARCPSPQEKFDHTREQRRAVGCDHFGSRTLSSSYFSRILKSKRRNRIASKTRTFRAPTPSIKSTQHTYFRPPNPHAMLVSARY